MYLSLSIESVFVVYPRFWSTSVNFNLRYLLRSAVSMCLGYLSGVPESDHGPACSSFDEWPSSPALWCSGAVLWLNDTSEPHVSIGRCC